MRKIVVGLFMSLDGVIEGPGSGDSFALAGWTDPYWDDAIGELINENMTKCAGLLLGRVTYQGFEAAFSSETHEMAEALNRYPKYVVSTTLEKATWNNSTLLKSVDEVSRLKQQPGKDLFVNGSGTLAASLMRHNLIDEYQLLVYPVVLGQGKRLFPNGFNTNLKFVESKVFNSGVMLLTYQSDKS